MSLTIKNQGKLAGIVLAAGLVWTAFGPGTALAASPSQEACTACGGVLVNDSGTKICACPEEKVGNQPENSQGQTTQTTTTGQGNLDNKTELNCSGPPGQQDPGCP
jgi:hypothetical protein